MYSKERVLNANVQLHTTLADTYKQVEPHYRPENIERVRHNLLQLKKETEGEKLLDVGCGSGFIIDIAKELFSVIRGVDITPAMLEKVDTNSQTCDIKVQLCECEKLPFADNTFDLCTAHAVLHHLHDIEAAIKEIFRVLKPGGILYADLDPNYYFWEAMEGLPREGKYSDFVYREIAAVLYKDKEMEECFNVDREVFHAAEHLKHVEGGFKEECIAEILQRLGFSAYTFRYEWFLGEAKIIHGEETKKAAPVLRQYLHEALPLSRHLFKYISFTAKK